jgi:hypothetical protein
MLKVAHVVCGQVGLDAAGVREATWIMLHSTGASALVGVALFLLGVAPLPRPEFEGWLALKGPAFGSPKLTERVRQAT